MTPTIPVAHGLLHRNGTIPHPINGNREVEDVNAKRSPGYPFAELQVQPVDVFQLLGWNEQDERIQTFLDTRWPESKSTGTFPEQIRHMLRNRFRGVCMSPFCIGYLESGYPRSGLQCVTPNGNWCITLAHYDMHHGRSDHVKYVRCLCRYCHAVEEALRLNIHGFEMQMVQPFHYSPYIHVMPDPDFMSFVIIDARRDLPLILPQCREDEIFMFHLQQGFQEIARQRAEEWYHDRYLPSITQSPSQSPSIDYT